MKHGLNGTNGKKSKAQSLIELTLVLIVLLVLLTGMVEVGIVLNNYINIVDAARTAAREAAVVDPLANPTLFKLNAPVVAENALAPLVLNPTPRLRRNSITSTTYPGDDIVISVYSIEKGSAPKKLSSVSFSKWGTQTTKFTASNVQAKLDPTAPNSGVVIVEIFYAHDQALGLPFLDFLNPIPLYTYSIMPMTAAEPTPTPKQH